MKKIAIIVMLLSLSCASAHAALTEVLETPNVGEVSVIGVGGILDTLYGLNNVQRVDDSIDQWWTYCGEGADVTAVAKYAGYNQSFGYFDQSDSFNALLTATANGYMSVPGSFTPADSGDPFRLGDMATSGNSFSLLWSSLVADNSDLKDHMVTWKILPSDDLAALCTYVVAFEDTVRLGDKDYNDLVVEIQGIRPYNPVPEPASMLLLGPALLGLVGLRKKRS